MQDKFIVRKSMKAQDFIIRIWNWFLELSLFRKIFVFCASITLFFFFYFSFIFMTLPKLLTMKDYKPPLLTEVYDRNEEKVGEFFKQRRRLFKYEDMPDILIHAFIAAEDGSFFSHKGINYKAILRAMLANLKAGRKVQGGSTITQQVARSLLLTSKKTYTRKIKEAILALRMESALSKQDILYIYLNQIYLGHGAYGVELASQIYFRKSTKELTLAEASLIAGIPKAPSRFSPIFNPERAKSRQAYVLSRMFQEGYITKQQAKETLAKEVKVYVRENFNKQAPYYLETVRRILLEKISGDVILKGGLRIYTSMDFEKQVVAKKSLRKGLEDLDKRQGFRGVKSKVSSSDKEISDFLTKESERLRSALTKYRILPSYEFIEEEFKTDDSSEAKVELRVKPRDKKSKQADAPFPWKNYKSEMTGVLFKALVSKVNKKTMEIRVPWGVSSLNLSDLEWAQTVEKKKDYPFLEDLKTVFKVNDVVTVRLKEEDSNSASEEEISLELYQEPLMEGALLSFDLETEEVLALVGGYDYKRSQFNRTYQSNRQLGSVFKPFVYGAALERGLRPNSIINDNPLVFTKKEAEEGAEEIQNETASADTKNTEEVSQLWRPKNISDRFLGDILFRSGLIRSLNVPTIEIIKKVGLSWVNFYAHRIGILNKLNPDYTMALGSSSVNLYEISKAFSVFPRGGKKMKPILIFRVEDREGNVILPQVSMDYFFEDKIKANEEFVQEEKKRWFKDLSEENRAQFKSGSWQAILDPESEQLIPAQNSYIMTNLLQGVVSDSDGTGRRAQSLKRSVGGKTGTSDGYYDTWFIGFSSQISTGVWVGFDKEKSLGRGETGSRVALPVWVRYMQSAHKDLPDKEFTIPKGIVFVNIDGETGGLVSSSTKKVVRQAFKEGEEPSEVMFMPESSLQDESVSQEKIIIEEDASDEDSDDEQFIRQDLSK